MWRRGCVGCTRCRLASTFAGAARCVQVTTTCVLYAHDDPTLFTAGVADVGIANMMALTAATSASTAGPMTDYKQVAAVKCMDVHVSRPYVMCGDEVRLLACASSSLSTSSSSSASSASLSCRLASLSSGITRLHRKCCGSCPRYVPSRCHHLLYALCVSDGCARVLCPQLWKEQQHQAAVALEGVEAAEAARRKSRRYVVCRCQLPLLWCWCCSRCHRPHCGRLMRIRDDRAPAVCG
jgi:hypothetical protein